MERKTKISASQFFLMMFVSRAVVTIALNAQYTGGENLLESVVSCVAAMLLGFVMALPIFLLHRRYPYLNVGDVAKLSLGGAGKAVPALYLVYFIFSNGTSLALFEIFLLDTINPDFSSVLVLGAIAAVALYGAYKGLESVARCAVCVFVVLALGILLVFSLVVPRFRAENLEPLFTGGFRQAVTSTLLFTARASVFADMAVLLPMVKGKSGWGFSLWSFGAAGFLALLLFLMAGCLGRYAYTQNFPVYVLASITEIRSLQRVDAVFVGVWMLGIIIRLSCDIYACRVCFSALCGGEKPKLAVAGAGLSILLLGLFAARVPKLQAFLLNTWYLFLATAFVGFLMPLLVLLADGVKRKGKGGAAHGEK